MSRADAVLLASRALAVLFIVWALAEVANVPGYVQSFLHYSGHQAISSTNPEYWDYWAASLPHWLEFCDYEDYRFFPHGKMAVQGRSGGCRTLVAIRARNPLHTRI